MRSFTTIEMSDEELNEFLDKYLRKYIEQKTGKKVEKIDYDAGAIIRLEEEDFDNE